MDLDSQSCDFAQNTLGLKRVFNRDAVNIKEYINAKFSFIYCRHVIEHLIDPTAFMGKIINYLDSEGLLVVQVPNGNSLEYLAYPRSSIRSRFSSICKTNNFSRMKVLRIMISGGMLHGVDPPRHLWAITKDGMKKWASKRKIVCEAHTYNLGDPAYSPYYKKGKRGLRKVQDFIGQKLLSMIHGGTHLVSILKSSVNTD